MASLIWCERMVALDSGALWGDLVLQWDKEDAAIPLERQIQQKTEELRWAEQEKLSGRWRMAAELEQLKKQLKK
jgi:hypothetical protein